MATLRQFEYSDLTDIMTAIQDSATWLTDVEANLPNLTPAPAHPQTAATLPQAPGEDDSAPQDGSTARDEAVEGPDAAEQATGDAQPAPDASIPADQLQLF